MPKVRRITPEQYLELASIGLPIWSDSWYMPASWYGGAAVGDAYMTNVLYYLMDAESQEEERDNAKRQVEEGTYKDYFTLVDD